jgi:hypothetical protein
MDNITIRKATFKDVTEIASVHINSWREAYKGQYFVASSDYVLQLGIDPTADTWKRIKFNVSFCDLIDKIYNYFKGCVGGINE